MNNVENLIKLADAIQNETVEINLGNDITINVRKAISLEEFYAVCGAFTKSPFAKIEDGSLIYVPSAEVTTFKVAIIKTFTDIELPDDIAEAYMLISRLGLFEKVHNALSNSDMYYDLCAIFDRWSEYHRLSNIGLDLSTLEGILSNVDFGEELTKVLPELTAKQNRPIQPLSKIPSSPLRQMSEWKHS